MTNEFCSCAAWTEWDANCDCEENNECPKQISRSCTPASGEWTSHDDIDKNNCAGNSTQTCPGSKVVILNKLIIISIGVSEDQEEPTETTTVPSNPTEYPPTPTSNATTVYWNLYSILLILTQIYL